MWGGNVGWAGAVGWMGLGKGGGGGVVEICFDLTLDFHSDFSCP